MTTRAKAGMRSPARKKSAAVTQAEPIEPAETCAETRDDTPLDYMLAVMRDPAVEPARRDEMAKLALPYLHPKPAVIEHTDKDVGPTEISEVSEADILRRLGFIVARGEQGKAE